MRASSACCSSSFRPTSRPMQERLRGFLASPRAPIRSAAHRLRVPPRELVHAGGLSHPPRRTMPHSASRRATTSQRRRCIPHPATPASVCAATAATTRRDCCVREALRALSKTRDVYVYFKHEDEPTGALNGVAFLKEALRLREPSADGDQAHRPRPRSQPALRHVVSCATATCRRSSATSSPHERSARSHRELVEVAPAQRTARCKPGALPLPLAAGRGSRTAPDRDHRARPRRLVELAVRRRQRQQALARRLQRHPHEHAQLRWDTRDGSRRRSTTPASPAMSTP
jgi:hypothetical protein